jgi:hypothetical protein
MLLKIKKKEEKVKISVNMKESLLKDIDLYREKLSEDNTQISRDEIIEEIIIFFMKRDKEFIKYKKEKNEGTNTNS